MIQGVALVMGREVTLLATEHGFRWYCSDPGVLAAVNATVPPDDLRHETGNWACCLLDRLAVAFDAPVRKNITAPKEP